MTFDPQDYWTRFFAETPDVLARRPRHDFDPEFFTIQHPAQATAEATPDTLHAAFGQLGGFRNRYARAREVAKDLDQRLNDLVRDPDLRAAMAAGEPGAHEVFFEIIALGDPGDRLVSDFSEKYYLAIYPDIGKAKVHPFEHFILHGIKEKRQSLRELRQGYFTGDLPFDPDKETCLVAVHEMSRSGAPIVGLDLVRQASKRYNVVVMALRGGELVEAMREVCSHIVITSRPETEFEYLLPGLASRFSFAVLNSVECFPMYRFLLENKVPFAAYIHEFAQYTLPQYKVIFSCLMPDLLVFSSETVRDSWSGVMRDVHFSQDDDSLIVPQQDLLVRRLSAGQIADARARLSQILNVDIGNRKVVISAGHMQWRKGTDLFFVLAEMCRHSDPDTLFVWIGDGRNHEDVHFGVWVEKHLTEAARSPLPQNLFTIPAGSHYLSVMDAADVFFLPSRMDPLPNVVFDAAERGTPVVVFQGGTGFDDARYDALNIIRRVSFGNLDAARDEIRAAPMKADATLTPVIPTEAAPPVFARIETALLDRRARQRNFVIGAGDFDAQILTPAGEARTAARQIEREKILGFGRRFVWPSVGHAQRALDGMGDWVHGRMRIDTHLASQMPATSDLEFGVHFHAHYIDDVVGDFRDHPMLQAAQRLLITTDTRKKADFLTSVLRDYGYDPEVLIVPNRGRDILPFIQLFADGGPGHDCPVWCHLHHKKSISWEGVGDPWRRYLMGMMGGLADGRSFVPTALSDPGVGLLAAFDPYCMGWGASRALLADFSNRIGRPMPEELLMFPVGNMFWARTDVATRMLNIFGKHYPWPGEPLPNDGSVYHAIERFWPAVAAELDYDSVFVFDPEQSRL